MDDLLVRRKTTTVRDMSPKTCPKCNAQMHPGFPVEVGSKGGMHVTRWSGELPQEISGILGLFLSPLATGHTFMPRAFPKELLMGFACEQCGYVELYKVSDQQLQQFLQGVAAQQPVTAGENH